jgi:hypothetical protein
VPAPDRLVEHVVDGLDTHGAQLHRHMVTDLAVSSL